MTVFFNLPSLDFTGAESPFTIATSVVIVNSAHDKILLHTGESTGKWQFIGGRYDDTMTFRQSALSHGHEVVGKDNAITLLDTTHPIILLDVIDLHGYPEKTLLIHYEATIADDESVGSAEWYTLEEIEILDAKNETSSSNVRIVAEKILGGERQYSDRSGFIDPSLRGGRDMQV